MQPDPFRDRELLGQRLLNECVRKPVARDCPRELLDQPFRQRLLEGLLELVLGEGADEPRKLVEPELPSEQRRDSQDVVAGAREAIEAAADDLAHALGDPEAPCLPIPESLWCQFAVLYQESEELPEEERVPLGVTMDRGDERTRRGDADGGFDELPNLLFREASEPNAFEELLAGELGEGLDQRVASHDFDVAVGAENEQWGARELARDELQEHQ